MRRILVLLTVTAVIVAMMVAMAMPAFAVLNSKADCVGKVASAEGGQSVSGQAKSSRGVSEEASTNCSL